MKIKGKRFKQHFQSEDARCHENKLDPNIFVILGLGKKDS